MTVHLSGKDSMTINGKDVRHMEPVAFISYESLLFRGRRKKYCRRSPDGMDKRQRRAFRRRTRELYDMRPMAWDEMMKCAEEFRAKIAEAVGLRYDMLWGRPRTGADVIGAIDDKRDAVIYGRHMNLPNRDPGQILLIDPV